MTILEHRYIKEDSLENVTNIPGQVLQNEEEVIVYMFNQSAISNLIQTGLVLVDRFKPWQIIYLCSLHAIIPI